ncbi:cilia- and flagella-associated protein 77 [Echeneis naucrates]|uniref:cilia- and flagella-associated protein 77 n=1 Tax=Echeneis naucrates TaxID=173247 RepID=UPI001113D865|nr:cilia- and flagella-associated protein 77 [Echeneis naucrates]
MSSPRGGVIRDSMLTNPVLIKTPLGQSRSRGLSLPGPDSRKPLFDPCAVSVLSSWRVQSRQGDSAPRRPAVPDFVSLNRGAIKSGLMTSKELSQFRAQGGGARTKVPTSKQQGDCAVHHVGEPDIAFGVTASVHQGVVPAVIHCLLSFCQCGRRWLDQHPSRNQTCNHRDLHRVPSSLDSFRGQETRARWADCVQVQTQAGPNEHTNNK